MIPFKNEQYLPCAVTEISHTSEGREISRKDVPLYLRNDLFVYPLNEGYIVENNQGQFVIDSLNLLLSVQGKSVNEISPTAQDTEELEQYYRYGLIGYEGDASRKLIFPEVDGKYSNLYHDLETTWFSQIPLKIELDITKKCNLRCIHCSREASSATVESELSLQDYVDIIQQAGDLRIPEMSFMGGEPTCDPSFIELATLARMSGIRTLSTSTNGWNIDEDLAKKMALLFDSVQVSIHGADAATHDVIVGRSGAFSRACRAVRLLREQGVASLNISCTVMDANAHQMEKMVQLAHSLEVPSIRFLVLFSKGRGRRLDQWKLEEKAEMADKIRSFREGSSNGLTIEGGGFPPYGSISDDASVYGCPAGRSLIYISADGEVRACGNLDHTIGNIKNQQIMDLWHSEEMIALRKRPTCECPYTKFCSGGCLGNENWSKMFNIDTIPIMK
jgi:radical SAM protein with 4Fe4S-binding SPASM domain